MQIGLFKNSQVEDKRPSSLPSDFASLVRQFVTLSLHNTVHDTTQKTKAQAWFCWMLEACMLTSSRSGEADSVDRETDRVSWCCSESGRRILGLFVLPVTWCHCDLCCTRCIPYGQLGSDKEKRISHKPQIVSSFQIKHCCLSKKNELKIRSISILVKKRRPIHR